jgi:hypothetical protein
MQSENEYERVLVLRTSDINQASNITAYVSADNVSVDINNTTGQVTNKRMHHTFYNIDLRTLCGETMWNKFDRFKLHLNNLYIGFCIGDVNPTANTKINGREIRLSGLTYEPPYWNAATKSYSNSVSLTTVHFPAQTAGTAIQLPSDGSKYIFLKPLNQNVNLTIDLIDVNTGTYPELALYTEPHGHMVLHLHIAGIQNEPNKSHADMSFHK